MNGKNGYDASAREWRGINPDGTPDEAMLRRITAAIVEAVQPERVIPFGSAARGEMTPKSDLDLLVIIKDDEHYREAAWKIHTSKPTRTRRVDLVVATEFAIKGRDHRPRTQSRHDP